MGYWVASLGFGPIGHIGLGAWAGLVGAPLAQATTGILIATIFLGTYLFLNRKLLQSRA